MTKKSMSDSSDVLIAVLFWFRVLNGVGKLNVKMVWMFLNVDVPVASLLFVSMSMCPSFGSFCAIFTVESHCIFFSFLFKYFFFCFYGLYHNVFLF